MKIARGSPVDDSVWAAVWGDPVSLRGTLLLSVVILVKFTVRTSSKERA